MFENIRCLGSKDDMTIAVNGLDGRVIFTANGERSCVIAIIDVGDDAQRRSSASHYYSHVLRRTRARASDEIEHF